MPDRQFIHAREDVCEALCFAQSMGLSVFSERLPGNRVPQPLSSAETLKAESGVYFLLRPDWIAAPLEAMQIHAGANAGSYLLKNVNFAAIHLYFQGEGGGEGSRRFGSGFISFKREWLHDAANEMRPAPVEVGKDFDVICKHLLSGIAIRAGSHRYHIARYAAIATLKEPTLPPFDFIPWPPSSATLSTSS